MITVVKKRAPLALMLAVVLACCYVFEPSLALTNDGSITAFGTPIAENFDSLAQTGTTNTWTDNTTIKGFYSNRTVYLANSGGTNNGGLYSFGAALTNPIGDRALGSVGSGSANPVLFGVKLTNDTGGTITSLAVSYNGEQWRNGGNTTAHTLTFQYQVGASSLTTGTWTTVTALNFTGPVTGATAATLDGNAPGNRVAISGTLPVSVNPGQAIWLRWQDPDDVGSDHGLAVDDLSITASGIPGDSAPTVSSTIPAHLATGVAVGADIKVNFSESVAASSTAFTLVCAGPETFTVGGSPGSVFTLNPVNDLPYSSTCTVTVDRTGISDVDTSDPPDQMAADKVFSFTTQDPPPPVATNVIINEFDADTAGTDAAEFIELYDGGVGGTSLTGLTVVFYNGSNDLSYAAFDLDGQVTNAGGYFTLGNPNVPGVDQIFNPGAAGALQNGADAVALFAGNASDFPNGTPVTAVNLQDAVVYGTNDADDEGLLALLNAGEAQLNDTDTQSLQRCADGSGGARNTSTYLLRTPSPDGANNCPPPPVNSNAAVVISQLYGGGGNDAATYQNDYVELYNRSAAPVDLTGWSLQYTAADGDGWDFNKQPLGGTIGAGQYYLIALASGGTVGAPLPAANITGSFNMGATSGKIALVNSFDGLSGNCPVGDLRIVDMLGYGTADCYEGAASASPSNTTALFRANNGASDFNSNNTDFTAAAPAPRRTAPIVELGPLVLGTDPRSNGFNAPRDATIQVTFTEPVDVAGAWFDIACTSSGAHNSATVGASGSSHFITPNGNFTPGEQCTATLTASLISDRDTADADANTDHLPANYSWSFTVATGAAPAYPPGVHLTMGNPTGAAANEGQPDNFLMEKPEFALSYNRAYGRPNWVSWHLADEWVGTLTRFDTFRADPAVPPDWYRVGSFDFTGSGFDRGHMVPNADRDKETSIPINQATFLMSNMIAQAPDNNQGPWASLENYLRTLLPGNELYIVAGGAGIGGSGSNGGVSNTLANGNVTVPNQTWKAALVLPKGDDDLARVTCSTRTIAVIMPNTQGIRNVPWENYLVTVNAVESLTGYDLFSNLPPQIQYCIEAGTNGTGNLPPDTTPPSISCAGPDGVWHADNVSVSCTASDTGIGLANPGDASFSLGTMVVDGVEDANAGTNSREVCDLARNCATANGIAGHKIDRRAPQVTQVTAIDGAWHADNIALAHTAGDSGSGLANGADAAFSLVTSVAGDIEDANASTDARVVCDAVGNCAEAGPIGGIKIDRKAPVVTQITAADGAWHADNVALAHTASDGGSGLANAADASFSLVTSVANNTEDANASTNDRTVCDGVGHCVMVAAIAGNKIDRKAPAIALTTPPNGALYQLNRSIAASYACVDGGSGLASCAGTVGNGAPIDTATAGVKTFVVNAADAVGNVSSVAVSYTVAANTIAISNIPAEAYEDESFVPAFAYAGDGATSVTSTTAKQCTVSGGVVNFHKKGTCILVAHAAGTATFDAATGSPQSFVIEKDKPKKKDQ